MASNRISSRCTCSQQDIDALQLFIASKITLLAPNALRSMDILTRGSAFWSTAHLLHLLDWTKTSALRPSQTFGSVEARLKTQLARKTPASSSLSRRLCRALFTRRNILSNLHSSFAVSQVQTMLSIVHTTAMNKLIQARCTTIGFVYQRLPRYSLRGQVQHSVIYNTCTYPSRQVLRTFSTYSST